MSEELNEIARNIRAEIEAQLAIKETQLKIAISALEFVDEYWDISNPESVVPKILEGEKYPNDSMAAGSIINAKQALEQIKRG